MDEARVRYPEILFICQGNVGRSQMAQKFFNKYSGSTRAGSAGTLDVAEKFGHHPTQPIIDAMRELGSDFDVSRQEIKQVTQDMVEAAQWVIILCERSACPAFFTLYEDKILEILVEDPHEKSAETIAEVRDQIKGVVLSLLSLELSLRSVEV